MNRPPDPPGVTYQGSGSLYNILLHGRVVGFATRPDAYWRARPYGDTGHVWTARTRREAAEGLVAWVKERL